MIHSKIVDFLSNRRLYNEQGPGMPFSVNLTLAQEGLFRRLVHQHLTTCKRLGITTFLTKGSLLGYYRWFRIYNLNL